MTTSTTPSSDPTLRLDAAGPSRRRFLGAAAAAGALGAWSSLSFAGAAAPGANRFVFVILRGGMDGLSAAPAIGDPDFAAARGPLGQFASAPLRVDPVIALHPNLVELYAMVGRKEAAVIQAAGIPYRERSHFDAQQVLESGGTRPYELSTGWLGRALATGSGKGIALSTAVPLVLRGSAAVDTWAPSTLPDPSSDLVARLEQMYAGDAGLSAALGRARKLHLDAPPMPDDAAGMAGTGNGARPAAFVALAQRAAEFLVQPNGPQAAVLEVGGWDTHANQANPNGPLANGLRQLDTGLATLRTGLIAGGAWDRTVVVVATEFGRAVAVNGTMGTDHGTGGVAFVLGGAVQGGRVIGEWPGLAKNQRYEGRDLRTTTDLRGVLKGILSDHMQVASRRLDSDVFPGSDKVKTVSVLRA